MDIHQTWWVSAALACFLVTQRAQCRLRRLWVAGFWACCGLGFMSKSFPGLLPIPIAGAFLLVAARWRVRAFACAIWNLHPLPGLVVLAAVIVPWHWLAYRDFGAYFVDQYWTQHHVGLLKATEYDHAQPVWYYIPGLLAGFFPWSLLLPSIRFAAGDFAPDTDAGRVRLLAVVWAALTFVAFSAMRSKLVSYLLPMYPACALLAASVVARAAESRRGLRVALPLGVGGILTLAVLLTTVFILAPEARRTTDPEAIAIATPGMFAFAYGALVSIAVGLLGGALQAVRDPARGAAVASTGMAVFVGLCGAVGIPEYDRAVNAPLRQAVAEASRRTSNEEPLVVHIGRPRRPSVFYYLPERLVARPLGRPTPGAFLVEQWDRALVRHDVASRPSTLVLADFRHGAETLPTATVVYRSGRWALFRARGSEAGSSP
jgi:4-amino-4-deoxy-L-arabinose transferase-like glycosyltransferase